MKPEPNLCSTLSWSNTKCRSKRSPLVEFFLRIRKRMRERAQASAIQEAEIRKIKDEIYVKHGHLMTRF